MNSRIVRPIQISADCLPRYRWPLQKREAPTHCVCGTRLIAGDIPTASFPIVDVACLMCSRVACELVWDGLPAPMTPERFAALPTAQGQRRPHAAWGTSVARLVRRLAEGGPSTARDLSDHLATSPNGVRNLVFVARQQGHQIACTTHGMYSIGGEQ